MSVTPLETLLAAAPTRPEEIELPGWYGGEAVAVRVKRPNFYHLLARDCVPNPLHNGGFHTESCRCFIWFCCFYHIQFLQKGLYCICKIHSDPQEGRIHEEKNHSH